MHPALDGIDARVERAFDGIRGPALDRVMYTLSSAADHSILWFGIGAARSVRHGDLRFAARFAAAMGVESALTNGPIKSVFRRTRPAVEAATGPLPYGMRRPITTSFPSGHATAAFTAATILAGRRRLPWYALATLVSASRVYVRMHHTTDVVAGAAFGLALGTVMRPLVRAPRG